MTRNTDISTILFPVELRPVNYTVAGSETAASTGAGAPASKNEENKSISQYKAVVRGDTGAVFAVVSNRYELLHNSRALDLGKKAFVHLFPEASANDFIVYDIQLTKTGSACHIDLIHKSYSTDVWEQETWLPFLRVSNSYNRSRALSFDFGFVRKLCSNGIIFRKETIQARFYHTKGRLDVDLKQDKSFQKLKELEREFAAHMKRLRETTLNGKVLLPLSIFLLDLKFDFASQDESKREQEQSRLGEVVKTLDSLITKYVKDLGENAYTALNAATDLATHSPSVVGPFATSAKLQQSIAGRSRSLTDQLGRDSKKRVEELIADQIALVN
jgi:hypothetical protein